MPADALAPPIRFPPGVAGKRRKPWLKRRRILRRTLRGIFAWDHAYLPEVVDLWVASWARTMPTIDFEARRPWLVERLREHLSAGVHVAVAIAETGDVVGFVTIDPATGWLDQIAVHPDVWGAGVAEALLAEARRVSPARVGLDVNADNARAVAFYEKQGFARIGEGANPRSGLPTLVLEWRPTAS
ncbi:MAG: GNAT family N-acetyltransferase [Hyphomicrobiales bacterium]|nr:GNAT family N-acetyltransferase [Hyphomicrobiales bacterium]